MRASFPAPIIVFYPSLQFLHMFLEAIFVNRRKRNACFHFRFKGELLYLLGKPIEMACDAAQ